MSMDQETESRFIHLLEPIRDLAVNWQIDIASELEDYLHELESIRITFQSDGASKTLNFSEAALLVQGIACVYSKKVEYLYSLLYKTLEAILDRKSAKARLEKKKQSSLDEDGNDHDLFFADDQPQLLPLDDFIQTSNAIDLRTENNEEDYAVARASSLIHRTPLAMRIGELNNSGDEKKGSSTGGANNGPSFYRLSHSVVHSSGALLMDESVAGRLDSSFRVQSAASLPFGTPAAVFANKSKSFADAEADIRDGVENEAKQLNFSVDFDDDDWGQADYDAGHNEEKEGKKHSNNDERKNIIPHIPVDVDADLLSMSSSSHDSSSFRISRLDPHQQSKEKPKPFRKCKIPKPSKSRSSANSTTDNQMQMILGVPSTPLLRSIQAGAARVPCSAEFASLYTKSMDYRRNAAAKKLKSTKEKVVGQDGWDGGVEYAASIVVDEGGDEKEEIDEGEIVQNNDGGDIDFDFDDDIDNGWDQVEESEPQSSDRPAFPGAFDQMPPSSLPYAPDGSLSYEALCRKHVDQFYASASSYHSESQLSRRVADWQNRLAPLLDEQEQRPSFDIHGYGRSMIRSIEQVVEKEEEENENKAAEEYPIVEFSKIVDGKPRHEVARCFLATLQLANSGNVEINKEGIIAVNSASNGDDHVHKMSVKLLSTIIQNNPAEQFHPIDVALIEKHDADDDKSASGKRGRKENTPKKGKAKKKTKEYQESDEENMDDDMDDDDKENRINDENKFNRAIDAFNYTENPIKKAKSAKSRQTETSKSGNKKNSRPLAVSNNSSDALD